MKLLFATFSILLILLSCNSKGEKTSIATVENVRKIEVNTIESYKKPSIHITKALVLGKFDYKTDSTFTKVSAEYSAKTIYLNTEVYEAFLKMNTAAAQEGVQLNIISGTRNFKEQKAIWERKWENHAKLNPIERAQKILEYSSMPSSSRHHWGTDLDLNSLTNSYFSSGKGKIIYNWLSKNAHKYGFYQVYTSKENGRTGYNLEKWHWSYLPLAHSYLEFYNTNITNSDISGFKGSELAKDLNIIEEYVNGISEKAKDYK